VLEALTSVPVVAGVAVITAALLVRDMLEGEKRHGTGRTPPGAPDSSYAAVQRAGQLRYRLYELVCLAILGVLVLLRFVTLAY
jgi:hypothetical protein